METSSSKTPGTTFVSCESDEAEDVEVDMAVTKSTPAFERQKHHNTKQHAYTQTRNTRVPTQQCNIPGVRSSETLPCSLGRKPVDGVGPILHRHQCSSCQLGRGPQLTLPSLGSGQTLELGVSAVSVGHLVPTRPLWGPPTHSVSCRVGIITRTPPAAV